ncbi:antitoxin MazE family protein [Pleomorphomonas sp. NRKKF1]|nr:antitoxin MazE family protein [Pleomorphomonas sp. NRK KF1]
MKQLRIWVPDPNRPEFAVEARRQGLILSGRAEEAEALGFIGAAFEWGDDQAQRSTGQAHRSR